MAESAVYMPSSRTGKSLIYRGFMYRLNSRSDTKQYFKCHLGCKATAVVQDGYVISSRGQHEGHHLGDTERIHRKMAITTIKKRCTESLVQPIPSIYKDHLLSADVNTENSAFHPTFASVKTILQRERSKCRPVLPVSRMELNLPEEFTQTRQGEPFLIANDGEEDRIMVFSTAAHLEVLCQSEIVLGDGTFKSSPQLFSQIYIIFGVHLGTVFPLVYALLPNKSESIYLRLLECIKTACLKISLVWNPKVFQTDFEMAMITAVRKALPFANTRGCLFHLAQSIWRYVQKVGLQVDYQRVPAIKKFVRRLASFALVPPWMLDEAWILVTDIAPADDRVTKLLDYFVDTYLSEDAFFKVHFWNHWHTTDRRTNNDLEGYNFSMNNGLVPKHGNIFKVVRYLMDEEDIIRKRILMRRAGQAVCVKNRKFTALDKQIDELKYQLTSNQRSLESYIDTVKYTLKLH